MYFSTVRRVPALTLGSYVRHAHIFCWGSGLLCASVLAGQGYLGYGGLSFCVTTLSAPASAEWGWLYGPIAVFTMIGSAFIIAVVRYIFSTRNSIVPRNTVSASLPASVPSAKSLTTEQSQSAGVLDEEVGRVATVAAPQSRRGSFGTQRRGSNSSLQATATAAAAERRLYRRPLMFIVFFWAMWGSVIAGKLVFDLTKEKCVNSANLALVADICIKFNCWSIMFCYRFEEAGSDFVACLLSSFDLSAAAAEAASGQQSSVKTCGRSPGDSGSHRFSIYETPEAMVYTSEALIAAQVMRVIMFSALLLEIVGYGAYFYRTCIFVLFRG